MGFSRLALISHNKAVLSPSAGTAIPLALHVSPKPRLMNS
jgi:hypothetical protein